MPGRLFKFLSQCLKAGGAKLSPQTDITGVIASVSGLSTWLQAQEGVDYDLYENTSESPVPTAFDLVPGDVIQFGKNIREGDNNDFDHSVIVENVGNPSDPTTIVCGMHNAWGEFTLAHLDSEFAEVHFYSLQNMVPVVGADVYIASGPTQLYPGSKPTYIGSFYCPTVCMPPWIWNWCLSFKYKARVGTDSSYTVFSYLDTNTGSSTWKVPAFTLDSIHQWIHNDSGLVMGEVYVVTADGYSAWKAVTYAEQNPKNMVRIRKSDGTIRIYFPTIETALQNIQSNESAEVLAGNYTITNEVNLTNNSGLTNITLKFAPSDTIMVWPFKMFCSVP